MTTLGREQILSYVSDENRKNISDIFKRAVVGTEFEFIFFSKKTYQMNKEKYVMLLKYMRNMAKVKKIKVTQSERSLDFSYTADTTSNKEANKETNKESDKESNEQTDAMERLAYRISVYDTKNINRILNRLNDIQNKNYLIYKFLLHTLKKEQ